MKLAPRLGSFAGIRLGIVLLATAGFLVQPLAAAPHEKDSAFTFTTSEPFHTTAFELGPHDWEDGAPLATPRSFLSAHDRAALGFRSWDPSAPQWYQDWLHHRENPFYSSHRADGGIDYMPGTNLRIDLPLGPVRIDYGLPLQRSDDRAGVKKSDRLKLFIPPRGDFPGPGYRQQKQPAPAQKQNPASITPPVTSLHPTT